MAYKPRRKARGSIEQLTDRWWLRIRTETVDAATGGLAHRRQRIELGSVAEIRSVAAARRAADAWIARQQPEQLTRGEQAQAGDYCERFIRLEVTRYRATTQRFYGAIIRRHLIPELGSLPLARISAARIKQLIADLVGKRLSRARILGVRAVLMQILRQAHADGFDVQVIDPKLVRVPTRSVVEREQRHITSDELDQILQASPFPFKALYACMGLLGLRVSEALALSWTHIDLDSTAPLISIRQSANGGRVHPLKTRTSQADLPPPAELVEILQRYRAVSPPATHGLLFATRTGRPWRAENVRERHWNRLIAQLRLPHAGFHALRHGLPRRLFAAGCSASVVRQLMRHGSLRMTERYTHATADDLRAAAAAGDQKRKAAHPCPQLPITDPQTLQK